MTHSHQQALPSQLEAQFSSLTARVLQHRPVTVEQVQQIGILAVDLAIIKRPQPARTKLIVFPKPPTSAEQRDQ